MNFSSYYFVINVRKFEITSMITTPFLIKILVSTYVIQVMGKQIWFNNIKCSTSCMLSQGIEYTSQQANISTSKTVANEQNCQIITLQ